MNTGEQKNPASDSAGTLKIGSRKSRLALWQTAHVIGALSAKLPNLDAQMIKFDTRGDQIIDQPLPAIGGKGLFTAELDKAITSGKIDAAVHSLKDLPTDPIDGLTIIPVLQRADVRDVLISKDHQTLQQLPKAAKVGTSSHRRQSQLLSCRPDLNVVSIRGNVPTRINKVRSGEYDAVVLAAAGVIRLDMQEWVAESFNVKVMLPAPGQASIAITCRSDDEYTMKAIESLVDPPSNICVQTERYLLNALGGGCSAPIAAYAQVDSNNGNISMLARVASLDGTASITKANSGTDPLSVAQNLAKNLRQAGADEILKQIQSNKPNS